MANEKRLIDANALESDIRKMFVQYGDGTYPNDREAMIYDEALVEVLEALDTAPTVDAVEVVHGRWKLEVRSFYRDTWDESCELCVYILASCSECNRKHPDSNQVFSKTLYAPEDADDDFRFDQKAEQEKALAEFIQRGYAFVNYCPNCGAKMDGGNEDVNLR